MISSLPTHAFGFVVICGYCRSGKKGGGGGGSGIEVKYEKKPYY